ncbi:MAG: DUF3365 domain-containing protein [Desulfobulbaceae bacterium]|jgi:two-component system NtrC family sensor kinase|nr:DUF3365 domain-containing protein [Desulfobulbaceae bacterium]
MQLKSKFILCISLIISCSYGITFYRTSAFQENLVTEQAIQQARMLFQQLRITRQWIADHQGLFLLKGPGVEPNPYLEDGSILDTEGRELVMRNPAMVTRELSGYAKREGLGQFRVTSLQPINPDNGPDPFETVSLNKFARGEGDEVIEVAQTEQGPYLRYIAALRVEESCLGCHGYQGYSVGDIRGGLSIMIPMDKAYAHIHDNNRMLLVIAVATIVVVWFTLFLLFDSLVVKRLSRLAKRMDSYPAQVVEDEAVSRDEIGVLSKRFHGLCERLELSQTELLQTREQVFKNEKQAALGRLVAGISHEINNPLGGMQNCIKTMERHPEDVERVTRYLGLLAKGVQRIKTTVRHLLDFGRQEPLIIQRGSVDKVIEECLELVGMGMRHITITHDLKVVDEYEVGLEALRQVVLNLGLNSVQAIGKRPGTLHVTSAVQGQEIIIQIEDSGGGIDPEHLDHIFDPFFTTKDVGEGTGLGLSVSQSLVAQMGGELTVRSEEGVGTCFTLTLPVTMLENQNGETP